MTAQPIPAHHRILVIDDNPSIHADFRKSFHQLTRAESAIEQAEAAIFADAAGSLPRPAFKLDFASQGEEGLWMVVEAIQLGRPYALAFIDMRMPPGWDGLETARELWRISPNLQVVICTAYSDHTWEDLFEALGETDRLIILKKPFETIEVVQLTQALTEKWRLLHEADVRRHELERRLQRQSRDLRIADEVLRAEMAGRATAEEAMREAQKMEVVGQLAAGVAHDFNNLLCVIRAYSTLLLDDDEMKEEHREALRQVDGAAERGASLTRQLLSYGQKEIIQLERLELNDLVLDLSKILHRVLGEAITLDIETEGEVPPILADRGMLDQVILNFAVNARDAMPNGGRLLIRSTPLSLDRAQASRRPGARPGHFACLSVIDTGSGIAPDVLARLFEPFFTTKEVGKGTGLGLATVQSIVGQHEGWVEVESTLGHGATFRIILPENTGTSASFGDRDTPERQMGRGETILFVEDDVELCHVAQVLLRQYGYRVIAATSGFEALEIWPSVARDVDLLFTDLVMPDGVTGVELAARLTDEKPGLSVLYTSGYSADHTVGGRLLAESSDFLPKPYTPAQLAAVVHGALSARIGKN